MSINSFGLDINQLGTSAYARTSYEVPPVYFTGIVEDIILNDKNGKVLKYESDGRNIGEILVRIIPDDQNAPLENLRKAYPLEANIQSYPLLGEQVIVYKALSGLFYTRSIASTRKVSDNDSSFLRKRFAKKDAILDTDARELARQGSALNSVFDNIRDDDISSMGSEYVRNSRARLLRANEGDVIVQGRYGNTIRFGSSLFSKSESTPPQPNIILTAGLWANPVETSTKRRITPYSLVYENLDNDASSLWMVSDQTVVFTAATQQSQNNIHLINTPIKTSEYTGAQVFLNSDRVILNSKKHEISLFSSEGINLNSLGAICLATENDVAVRSLFDISLKADNSINLDATSVIITAKNFSIKSKEDYTLQGKRVFIGTYGVNMQPLVLGNVLAGFLNSTISQIQLLQSSVGTLLTGVAKIPGAQAAIAVESVIVTNQLATIATNLGALQAGVSTPNVIFNSLDNFTARTNT